MNAELYTVSNNKKEHIFFYLELLKCHGETNMFGAAPYVAKEFNISKYEARTILSEWMNNYKNTVDKENI